MISNRFILVASLDESFSIVIISITLRLHVHIDLIALDSYKSQDLFDYELDLLGEGYFVKMLLVVLPVGYGNTSNHFKELNELKLHVLVSGGFILDRHLAEAKASLRLVLRQQVRLVAEHL